MGPLGLCRGVNFCLFQIIRLRLQLVVFLAQQLDSFDEVISQFFIERKGKQHIGIFTERRNLACLGFEVLLSVGVMKVSPALFAGV